MWFLGFLPVTYIPPYNKLPSEAVDIISKYFRIISGTSGMLKEGNIAEIGFTTETYNYNKNENVPIETIISDCKKSIEKTNLCVVVIHPQEYKDESNKKEISPEKFRQFKEMLDKLQQLNATFSTFKDTVYCEE